eukprot:scaffold4011_cov128-Skeletonema_marinoi.AAC.1
MTKGAVVEWTPEPAQNNYIANDARKLNESAEASQASPSRSFTKTDRMVHYYCRGINEMPKEPSAASGVHCAYLRSLIMSENRARGMPTIVDLDTSKKPSRRNDKPTDATPRSEESILYHASLLLPREPIPMKKTKTMKRRRKVSMLLHSLYIGRHRRQQNYLDATIMPAMILTNFSKNELNCLRMHLIIIMVIESGNWRRRRSPSPSLPLPTKKFLSKWLQIALEKLGGVKPDGTKTKWIDCCRLAVERAKLMGYRGVAADTIMEWNRHFCRDGKFHIRIRTLPTHQDHFTVDMVVEHFDKNMLPALHEEAKELGDNSKEKALLIGPRGPG